MVNVLQPQHKTSYGGKFSTEAWCRFFGIGYWVTGKKVTLILFLFCVVLWPVMESHGECEIKVQLNCSHCETQSCKRDEDTQLVVCLCHNEEVLTSDNVTCVSPIGKYPDGHVRSDLVLQLILFIVIISIPIPTENADQHLPSSAN